MSSVEWAGIFTIYSSGKNQDKKHKNDPPETTLMLFLMLACSSQTPAAALTFLHKLGLLWSQEIKPCFVGSKTKPFVL